jgi:hypothetical protein
MTNEATNDESKARALVERFEAAERAMAWSSDHARYLSDDELARRSADMLIELAARRPALAAPAQVAALAAQDIARFLHLEKELPKQAARVGAIDESRFSLRRRLRKLTERWTDAREALSFATANLRGAEEALFIVEALRDASDAIPRPGLTEDGHTFVPSADQVAEGTRDAAAMVHASQWAKSVKGWSLGQILRGIAGGDRSYEAKVAAGLQGRVIDPSALSERDIRTWRSALDQAAQERRVHFEGVRS